MIVRTRSGLAAYAIAFAALALLAMRSWRIDYDYSIDFQTYWLAGSRVLHGEADQLYAAGGGPAAGTPVAMGANEFKNIPLVAVAAAPLAAWDYATAKRIAWWIGLAAIAACAVLIGRWLLPEAAGPVQVRVALAFAALAAMAPTHVALRHGQTTALVALLIVVALVGLARRRPAVAGFGLGLACLVKFPPLALVGMTVARGRWRTAAWCIGTIVAGLLLSIAIFGPSLHDAYERGITEQAGRVMAGHNNQSLAAVATRFLDGADNQDWTPRPMTEASAIASHAAALGLAALLGWAYLTSRSRLAFDAAGALALGILVLPVAWDHYALVLVPALIATAGRLYEGTLRSRTALLVASAAAYVLLAVPSPRAWIEAPRTAGFWDALLLSHVFVGLLAVLAIAVVALRLTAAEPADADARA